MAQLSADVVYSLLRQAGASTFEASELTAVAFLKSKGDTAYARRRGYYGLFQIKIDGSLGKERLDAWGLKAAGQLYNPVVGAAAALAIFRDQGLSAWDVKHSRQTGQMFRETAAAGKKAEPRWKEIAGYTTRTDWGPSGRNVPIPDGYIATPEQTSPLAGQYAPEGAGPNFGGLGGLGGGGGGGLGGPASGGAGVERLAPNASEAEIVAYIEKHYGPAQVSLLQVPDLRAALIRSAQEGYDTALFWVEVEKTGWWKERTDSMRQWDMRELTAPLETKKIVGEAIAALAQKWNEYGVNGDLHRFAVQTMRLGMSPVQIVLEMGKKLQAEADDSGLDALSTGAVDASRLQQIARSEYLIDIDRATAERWALKVFNQGEEADVEAQFRAYLATLTSSSYGIDPASGVVPADLMAPIKQAIAQSLDLEPDTIDLLSEQFRGVLQQETKDGTFRPMTVSEATKWARSKEEFKGTTTAQSTTAALTENLLRTFGKVAS